MAPAATERADFHRCYYRLLPPRLCSLPYCVIRFYPERFSPNLFTQHACIFPPAIQKSVVKRQAEFLAGRLCARTVLARYGLENWTVGVGAHGEPKWPQGMIGSISHNRNYAAAVACFRPDLLGIGVDVESVTTDDTPEGNEQVMRAVLSPEERQYLRACGQPLGLGSMLAIVFSGKESFFKASFAQVGEYFDFDAVVLLELNLAERRAHFQTARALCPDIPKGYMFDVHFEFIDKTTVLTAVLLPNSHTSS